MFGSYTIDKPKDRVPRLSFTFKNGKIFFYTCSVKKIEGHPRDHYDWSSDLMSDHWSNVKAVNKIKKQKNELVCDILLDQDIFSGSGNIIKNEVLYRLKLHPKRKINSLAGSQIRSLATETRKYCFEFFKWKKIFELRKHWNIYKKKKCIRCNVPVKQESTGKLKRRTFYCNNCQV
jgi:endonuclease-8